MYIYIDTLSSKIKPHNVTDYVSSIVITLSVNLWLSREICTSRNTGNLESPRLKRRPGLALPTSCWNIAGGGWADLNIFGFEFFLSLCYLRTRLYFRWNSDVSFFFVCGNKVGSLSPEKAGSSSFPARWPLLRWCLWIKKPVHSNELEFVFPVQTCSWYSSRLELGIS